MKHAIRLGLMGVLAGGVLAASPAARADGCYLCEGGGYVAYKGEDTFEKRQGAMAQFHCKVGGTTSSCSNPKGTVSALAVEPRALLACEDHEQPGSEPKTESSKKKKKGSSAA